MEFDIWVGDYSEDEIAMVMVIYGSYGSDHGSEWIVPGTIWMD